MRKTQILPALAAAAMLSACSVDTTRDFGIDSGDLTAMEAGIWIDPNGCEHWIIDDGVEGYMSPRRNLDGTPKCREGDIESGATEDFERQAVGSK